MNKCSNARAGSQGTKAGLVQVNTWGGGKRLLKMFVCVWQ